MNAPAEATTQALEAHCVERAAPEGSTLHYALLFAGPGLRRSTLALAALRVEMDDIIEQCSDAATAGARLGWWDDEVVRLRLGRAQHPVTRALDAFVPGAREHAHLLQETLVATASTIGVEHFPQEQSLQQFCTSMAAGPVRMLAVTKDKAEVCTQHVAALSALLYRCEMLVELFLRPRRGRLALTLADMRAGGVGADAVFAERPADPVDAFVRSRARELQVALRRSSAELERGADAAQLPLLVQCRVAERSLAALVRNGHSRLARRPGISPLGRLWAAWITQARLHRRAQRAP